MGWVLLKTLFSLCLVIGLMFVTVYFLKRFVTGSKSRTGSAVDVDILGQRMIQPKASVVVLKTLNKIIVVGISDKGIQNLTEITDPKVLESVRSAGPDETGAANWILKRKGMKDQSFSKYLGMFWNRMQNCPGRGEIETVASPSTQFDL